MTRQIVVLAFLAGLCISLTNAQTSTLSCPIALQNTLTTFGKVVSQYATLQASIPGLGLDAFNCVTENSSDPATIITCITSAIPSETQKITGNIQALQTSLQALTQELPQAVTACTSGLAGGLSG